MVIFAALNLAQSFDSTATAIAVAIVFGAGILGGVLTAWLTMSLVPKE